MMPKIMQIKVMQIKLMKFFRINAVISSRSCILASETFKTVLRAIFSAAKETGSENVMNYQQ